MWSDLPNPIQTLDVQELVFNSPFTLLIADILIIPEICGSQFAAAALIKRLDSSFIGQASPPTVQIIQAKLRRTHKKVFNNGSLKKGISKVNQEELKELFQSSFYGNEIKKLKVFSPINHLGTMLDAESENRPISCRKVVVPVSPLLLVLTHF